MRIHVVVDMEPSEPKVFAVFSDDRLASAKILTEGLTSRYIETWELNGPMLETTEP